MNGKRSTVNGRQIEELRKIVRGDLLTNQPMKEYTSLRVGGLADLIVFPEDIEDLRGTIKYLSREHIPCFILGNGTNLLVRDGGIGGVVIALHHGFKRVELLGEDGIFAEAGVTLVSLIRFATKHSLSGLEFAAGIPGTVGGGIIMNAGGSMGELKDVTESVTILNPGEEITAKKREDLRFSYRNLQLPKDSVILSAVFRLKIDNQSHIRERIQKILLKRKETQPLDLPNAGSIFKNPEGASAGKLIDESGLKGMQIGNARVSELHANFILNIGNATAQDILSLMEKIQQEVYQKTGVMLETEIRIVGEN
ncbi:MAG: UDP-N-acetylmuramate dehydrogenase [Thermodesulfobacteriota bacterium]